MMNPLPFKTGDTLELHATVTVVGDLDYASEPDDLIFVQYADGRYDSIRLAALVAAAS